MIITDNQNLAAQAKYLTTQAKDDSLITYIIKWGIIIGLQIFRQL